MKGLKDGGVSADPGLSPCRLGKNSQVGEGICGALQNSTGLILKRRALPGELAPGFPVCAVWSPDQAGPRGVCPPR